VNQYKIWISKWLSGEIIAKTGKNGRSPTYIKRWLRETQGDKCSQCGWAEIHPTTGIIPVQIDHVNGNFMDNKPENVRLLCPNCHSLTPTFGALNKGQGRHVRLGIR
jgi:hypothetical protein